LCAARIGAFRFRFFLGSYRMSRLGERATPLPPLSRGRKSQVGRPWRTKASQEAQQHAEMVFHDFKHLSVFSVPLQ